MQESAPNPSRNIQPHNPYEGIPDQVHAANPFLQPNMEGPKDMFGNPTGIYDVHGNLLSTSVDQDPTIKTPIISMESRKGVEEVSALPKAKTLFLGKLGIRETVDMQTSEITPKDEMTDWLAQIENNPFLSNAPNGHKDNITAPTLKKEYFGIEAKLITSRPGEFVKHAPKFSEQVADTSRTNLVTYVPDREALGTRTEHRETRTLTEHDSLVALQDFLKKTAETESNTGIHAERALSMLENMTFIGKQEYDEATKGIADIWSRRLRENPNLQLCAITGKITEGMVKSDAYLLDNILKNFSDEQLDEFSGRLVLAPEDLTAAPEDVSIVMLDDWTISGSQLKSASARVMSEYPKYKDRVEIQLITATEERIQKGLEVYSIDNQWSHIDTNVPVNAYFAANAAPRKYASYSGAHITGAHCAVDYDFNNELEGMAKVMKTTMPPLTNIVRPYRKKGVNLDQSERLRGIKPKKTDQTRELV